MEGCGLITEPVCLHSNVSLATHKTQARRCLVGISSRKTLHKTSYEPIALSKWESGQKSQLTHGTTPGR